MSKTVEILIHYKKQNKTYTCYIDKEDEELVRQYKWSIKFYSDKIYYAVANTKTPEGKKSTITMHRLIMLGIDSDSKVVIDHLNGDGLDNRRANLRLADHVTNGQNRQHIGKNNTTGVIGVSYREQQWSANGKPVGQFEAYITVDKKQIRKSFAVEKYGYENAKQMAINQRKAWEEMYYDKWKLEP